MKIVKSFLILFTLITVFSCSTEDTATETKQISSSAKDTSPEDYAKSKLADAMKCNNENELESVIINFEQFIAVIAESSDKGKLTAKNIMDQENVTSQFYAEFITNSYDRLKIIKGWDLEDFTFSISNSRDENNLIMHKVLCKDKSGQQAQLDVMEAKGVYYFGQIRL